MQVYKFNNKRRDDIKSKRLYRLNYIPKKFHGYRLNHIAEDRSKTLYYFFTTKKNIDSINMKILYDIDSIRIDGYAYAVGTKYKHLTMFTSNIKDLYIGLMVFKEVLGS